MNVILYHNKAFVCVNDFEIATDTSMEDEQLKHIGIEGRCKLMLANKNNKHYIDLNYLILFIQNMDNLEKKVLSFQWVKSILKVIKSIGVEDFNLRFEMIGQHYSGFKYSLNHASFLFGCTRMQLIKMLLDNEVIFENAKIFYPLPLYANKGLFIHTNENIFLTKKGLFYFSKNLPIKPDMFNLIYGR